MSTTSTFARPRRSIALALICVAAFGLIAAAQAPKAHAGKGQVSLLMDDNLLLYADDRDRATVLQRLKSYGVDGVRVTMLWSVIGAKARDGRRARTFRGDQPGTYPHHNWDRYDRLVQLARLYKVALLFNVTGPGPEWAQTPTKNRLNAPTWRPKENAFHQFARAVGRRYSGVYRDENDHNHVLPRVNLWSIWNEPNQGASLTPQSDYSPLLKRWIPAAPIVYRRLLYAGIAGLRNSGHKNDVILMGETAPLGKDEIGHRRQLRPKLFYRELFCLKPNMQPYTGRAAQARECDRLKTHPFRVAGVAHHPYTQKAPPTQRDVHPNSVNMANIGDLPTLLDAIAGKTQLIPRGLPVALTENGYQTNPPDPQDGISLAKQAEYNNVADLIAYYHPRVTAVTQFLLRDVGPRAAKPKDLKAKWFTWQSGLTFENGRAKPAFFAYLLPFAASTAGRNPDGTVRVNLWGQVRAVPDGTLQVVYPQFRPAGQTRWFSLQPIPVINSQNFYEAVRSAPGPGTWRAFWQSDDRRQHVASREVILTG